MSQPVSGKVPWLGSALAGCVLFVLTLANHISRGRIQPIPSMDDATYFREALYWLNAFHDGGLPALLLWIANSPPHSLYSTLLALVSFTLFGTAYWAPYVGNGLTLALYVWCVRQAMSNLKESWTVLLLAAFLALPAASMTVSEFRPDLACGLLLTLGVLRLSRLAEEEGGSERDWILAGVFAGLAVVTKPSFAPYLAAVFLTAVAVAWLAKRPVNATIPAAKAVGSFLLVAMFDFALKGPREINYILDNVFGRYRDIWVRPIEGAGHASYHLFGEGGQFLFGPAVYALLVIAAAPLLLPPLLRLRWRRYGVLLAATAVAYAIAAGVDIKSPYSGSVFAATLVALAGYVLSLFLRPFEGRRGWIAAGILFGLFALWYRPAPNGRRSWDGNRAQGAAAARLVDELSARADAAPARRFRVWLTTYGHLVNQESLEFLCLQRGVRNIAFLDLHRTTAELDQRKAMGEADLIIAGSATGSDPLPWLPSNKTAARVLAMLQSDGRLSETGPALRTPDGGEFRLFARRPIWGNAAPVSGFGPVEGPFPEQKLGQVFWAIEPAAVAAAEPRSAAIRSWRFRARAPMEGQSLTVLQGDKRVGEFPFPQAGVDIDGAFDAAGDAPVTFRFAKTIDPSAGDTRRLAVLFSGIEVAAGK